MELIAAIDLLDGRSVRLREGDYGRRVQSRADPLELAARWAAAGVPALHVVDLEGARAGGPRQLERLADVIGAARRVAPDIRVQAGGGVRSFDAVAAVLESGADAAILGTAALERPGFLAACATRWPGRVFAALDVRDGRLAVDGWLRQSRDEPQSVARRLVAEGAAALLVTDTSRDGTLSGPNLQLLGSFRAAFPDSRLVAAGGIRSVDDLLELQTAGLDGAIVGMALLTGGLDVDRALDALAGTAAPQ